MFILLKLTHMTAMQDPLIRGVVKQVAVLILNAHGLVIEKFIADLKVLILITSSSFWAFR